MACGECQQKCAQDDNCGVVDCSDNYCSWWKIGICTLEDADHDSDYSTCRKIGKLDIFKMFLFKKNKTSLFLCQKTLKKSIVYIITFDYFLRINFSRIVATRQNQNLS